MKDRRKGEIWLISPSGSLPEDGWRPHRFNYLAKELIERGYFVRWWMPTFSHDSKEFRCDNGCNISRGEAMSIRFLACGQYLRHIGLARVVFLFRFALGFFIQAIRSKIRPEAVIVVTPSLGAELTAYLVARILGAKLIIDIIDIWPEFFLAFVPPRFQGVASVAFFPVRWVRDWVGSRANGVISCCESYLNVEGIRRSEDQIRACIYWGGEDVSTAQRSHGEETTRRILGREKDKLETWVVYGGTLGNNYDILTLLDCAKWFLEESPNVIFIIAGGGPLAEVLVERIERDCLKNVVFLGRISSLDLQDLYLECDVGVSSYIGTTTVAMPIKFYDYVSAGLPVVNSIEGELSDLIRDKKVGLKFDSGDYRSLGLALRELASNGEARRAMAANCRQLAADFRPNRLYSKYGEIVEEIVGAKC